MKKSKSEILKDFILTFLGAATFFYLAAAWINYDLYWFGHLLNEYHGGFGRLMTLLFGIVSFCIAAGVAWDDEEKKETDAATAEQKKSDPKESV